MSQDSNQTQKQETNVNVTQEIRKQAPNDAETIKRLRDALEKMNTQYMQVKIELEETQTEYNKLRLEAKQKDNNNNYNNYNNNNNNNNNNNISSNPDSNITASNVFNKFQKFRSTVLSGKNRSSNTPTQDDKDHKDIIDGHSTDNNIDDHHSHHNNHHNNHQHNDLDNNTINIMEGELEKYKIKAKNLSDMLQESVKEKEQLRRERDELLVKYTDAMEQITRIKTQTQQEIDQLETLHRNSLQEYEQNHQKIIKELHEQYQTDMRNGKIELESYKETIKGHQQQSNEMKEKWEQKCDLIVAEKNALQRKVKSLQSDLTKFLNSNNNTNITATTTTNTTATTTTTTTAAPTNTTTTTTATTPTPTLAATTPVLTNMLAEENASLQRSDSHSQSYNHTMHEFILNGKPPPPPLPPRPSHGSSTTTNTTTHHENENALVVKNQELRKEIIEMKRKHEIEKTQLTEMVHRLSNENNVQSQKGTDVHKLVNSLSTIILEKEEIIRRLQESKHILGEKVLQLEQQIKNINLSSSNNTTSQ